MQRTQSRTLQKLAKQMQTGRLRAGIRHTVVRPDLLLSAMASVYTLTCCCVVLRAGSVVSV